MKTQRAIIVLRRFFLEHKRLPSYRELAALCGYASPRASVKLADKLIAEGMLAKDRTGHLTPAALFALPHVGSIRAGLPTDTQPFTGESLDLSDLFLALPQGSFSLTVRGDSMKDAGICEGDTVIVVKRTVKPGDIVAACVDGEWTVKYFQQNGRRIQLVPANTLYPILSPTTSFTIAGVVVHVLRTYT